MTHPSPEALPLPAGWKPLTDEQIAEATGAQLGTPMWLVALGFTRAIEQAHGIGVAAPAAPVQAKVDEREEFERWASDEMMSTLQARDSYRSDTTASAWAAWQARARLAEHGKERL